MNLWENRLKEERIRLNWRQQDLADQLGTSVVTVQRWERGCNYPGAYFRTKLCVLFAKSAEELGFVSDRSIDPDEGEKKVRHFSMLEQHTMLIWKDQLRQERVRRNWRQQDLADHLGTSVVTVQRWERGSHCPSAYFRIKLCALFGKSAEELGFVLDEMLSSEEEDIPSR